MKRALSSSDVACLMFVKAALSLSPSLSSLSPLPPSAGACDAATLQIPGGAPPVPAAQRLGEPAHRNPLQGSVSRVKVTASVVQVTVLKLMVLGADVSGWVLR